MTSIRSLAAIIMISCFACAHAEGGYEARYKLKLGQLTVGEMERRFEIGENNAYLFVSKIQSTGLAAILRPDKLVETSTGQLRAGAFEPAHYSYDRKNKKKPRQVDMRFDRANQRIELTLNGERSHTPLTEGLLDKLVYQAALMRDLQTGVSSFEYRIADRGEEKVYRPLLGDEEIVETPFGSYQTVKLVRSRSKDKRQTIFWCAPELGYLPVKVAHRDKKGKETIVLLVDYRRYKAGVKTARDSTDAP